MDDYDGIATINPGVASDTCDGIDNDCDGLIDEDLDTLEPNDSSFAYYMGDLDQVGDTLAAISYMTHENDEDAFSLYLFDNPGVFTEVDSFYCEFVPPQGVDIEVGLFFNGSSLGIANTQGAGAMEAIQYNATWLVDDTGTYTFVVNNVAGGSSCDIMTVYCESKSFT